MDPIGIAVQRLRKESPYRDLRSFASHAGLSYEGIRKIETGERIPSVETIQKIIDTVGLGKSQSRELRVQRDLAHAEREGLLNKGVTDEKIGELASASVEATRSFLSEFDMDLSDEDQQDLFNRLQRAILEGLRA